MNLDTAISAHAEWKTKLRGAIQKKEQIDATGLASDNKCELGKWLHGEAKAKFGKLPSHAACVASHAEFHRAAGSVAQAINAGKYSDAETMLGASTPYSAASSAVGTAIIRLRKEAAV
jgi:methyl-accepting chemotaxis protein